MGLTCRWLFKPVTLSVLAVALIVLAYVAMSPTVIQEGRDKSRIGIYAALAGFLLFSMVQFRDGPFIRPHPAFWRIVRLYSLLLKGAEAYGTTRVDRSSESTSHTNSP